ncbi:hypothetical protein [uncultured virus]|uniref:Uncharacterized protein n=1 Tax=uncultured virus TaxID=340016 RepID=A0A1I9XGC4_9VIRU|nr:hypothetical protein [uncultured virus]
MDCSSSSASGSFDIEEGMISKEEIFRACHDEVVQWMALYGRGHIREWMADNAKNILKSDGVLSSGGKRKLSIGKKVPLMRQDRILDFTTPLKKERKDEESDKENKFID